MEDHLEDAPARTVALTPTPDDGGAADRGAAGLTSLLASDPSPGLDAPLDRLGPWLRRFEINARRVVVEIELGGRCVGVSRPILDGEHDTLAIAALTLEDAEIALHALRGRA